MELRGEELVGVRDCLDGLLNVVPVFRLGVAEDAAAAFVFSAIDSMSEANAFVNRAPFVPRGFFGFRCSLYLPDKKYSFNNGECTKHWRADDMKQVFPKLFNPHADEE